jgi:hypothetical protein
MNEPVLDNGLRRLLALAFWFRHGTLPSANIHA